MPDAVAVLGLILMTGTVVGVSTLRRRASWRKAVRLAHGPFDLITARPRLDQHITTLVGAFGIDTFSAPPVELPGASPRDRGEFLRSAVDLAAGRFQVTLPTVDLQFAPPGSLRMNAGLIDGGGEIWAAGRGPEGLVLELAADKGWRIRIAVEFRLNDAAILIIAAHEVAHLVLCREQLAWQNEELVDVAIVLLGYGPVMRRFRKEAQVVRIGGRVRSVVCGPGYLHPDAIEYVWQRRQELMHQGLKAET
jgi:hypothetical protein